MLIQNPGASDLELGEGRTRLMAVLNVTPDSFSDGGQFLDSAAAIEHGLSLAEAGADILDIGGESTRPGHEQVGSAEQCERILPVIRGLKDRIPIPISVDTTQREVAAAALDAGASWINDTAALHEDEGLAELAAERGSPLVLMHRFRPARSPGVGTQGRELVQEIADHLASRMALAEAKGVQRSQIILDPGIGFGTLPEDNHAMHMHLEPLRELGRPLLYGPSRKSFLGAITGKPADQRLMATAASVACLALAGVEIIRVHDLVEMREVVDVVDAIRNSESMSRTGEEL
ncbi:MAG: dihydropteroate synthase [Planctomycetota bacterium]|jgi:dihydropteroate synthase